MATAKKGPVTRAPAKKAPAKKRSTKGGVWQYINKNSLQDRVKKTTINADVKK